MCGSGVRIGTTQIITPALPLPTRAIPRPRLLALAVAAVGMVMMAVVGLAIVAVSLQAEHITILASVSPDSLQTLLCKKKGHWRRRRFHNVTFANQGSPSGGLFCAY